jgi:hypothetical protein
MRKRVHNVLLLVGKPEGDRLGEGGVAGALSDSKDDPRDDCSGNRGHSEGKYHSEDAREQDGR